MNVPLVWLAFGVNDALCPAGRFAKLAVSAVIASPSGSAAVTCTVIRVPALPLAAAGAVTTGARSAFWPVMTVAAEPLSAFDAVNVTVWLPA